MIGQKTSDKAEPTRLRIALFGAFGVGNLGNECTLQALMSNIQRCVPRAEVSCICMGPQETQLAYNIPASLIKELPLRPIKNPVLRFLRRIFLVIPMELFRWGKAVATLKDVNMLVMTGTGMLGDFGISPLGLHYEILKWTVAAKLARCKIIFLSVGAGPLRKTLSRHFVRAALSCADYRSYRDQFSKDYLKSIHFDSDCDRVYPDLAFSYPIAMLPADSDHVSNGTVIGLGLMTYFNRRNIVENDETTYHEYIAKLGTFVAWLLEKKYTVRLLIGDASYDDRARHDLNEFIEEHGIIYEDSKIIDEPAASVQDVFSQLNGTDLVVASRFHNVLMALMLGKPVLAISYHEKVDALMADAGLTEFCQDIERIDVEKMTRQFNELEKKANCIKRQLQRNAEACRAALEGQYSRIFGDHFG